MRLVLALRTMPIAYALLACAAYAGPGERDRLNACQAMVDRASRTQPADAASAAAPDELELEKCRQIIKEWTLRDSRMSIDEQGRPLR